MYLIAVINLGSTSTKFSYYEDENPKYQTTIDHDREELKQYPTIWEQFEYRLEAVLAELEKINTKPEELDAIVTRGGHTVPLEGGVYRITDLMLEQSATGKYGRHATDLGLRIAARIGKSGACALTVDSPVTDEFTRLARYGGIRELQRKSSFHALNHRAVAKQYARDIQKPYGELRLIGAHMGGGITIACHKDGRMVDATNGLVGDGPFSGNRPGTMPARGLIDLCYSGKYTKEQLLQKLTVRGGLMSYAGDSDLRRLEQRIAGGDSAAREAVEAMAYQVGKEICAMSAVLEGKADAIYLTGGMAYSDYLTGLIRTRVGHIARIVLYPGEYEMQALALGALEVLQGKIKAKELEDNAENI